MLFDGRMGYITVVVVCETVGALHLSRVVSRQGAVGIRRGVCSKVYRDVGWGRSRFFCGMCLCGAVTFLFNWNFK